MNCVLSSRKGNTPSERGQWGHLTFLQLLEKRRWTALRFLPEREVLRQVWEELGSITCLLVDSDTACIETLKRNGFTHTRHAKVEDVDFTPFAGVSLLCGGPPCQPWSLGGKDSGQGDERNGWESTLRAVEQCRPQAVLLENVRGFLRPKFAAYRESIRERLEGMGYHLVTESVNAKHYGVPQHRERVFIVGFLSLAARAAYVSPPATGRVVTVREALSPLGEPDGRNGHVLHGNARAYAGHTGSSLDGVAKTITSGANGLGGGANTLRLGDGSVRYFTVREAATLQTFPTSYQFPETWTTAYRQIGNSVPVELAYVLGVAVAAALKSVPWLETFTGNNFSQRPAAPRQIISSHEAQDGG